MTSADLWVQGRAVRDAAREVSLASNVSRTEVLRRVATLLDERCSELLVVNADEVSRLNQSGPARDRLTLTTERVLAMAGALREIADRPDPLGEQLDQDQRPNGLRVHRRRVPLGVVGVVYENRPNVTSDVAGLCIRSGNAAFLRGSSTALASNRFIVGLWHEALAAQGLPTSAVSLVEDVSHETVALFMGLTGIIDCLIPRGGPSLIAAMREHARVPYVLDGDGNCHVYVDASADLEMAVEIARNAKTSRPGVCNAAETFLVHRDIAAKFWPAFVASAPEVAIRADGETREIIDAQEATEDDFAREFLDLVVAGRVVSSIDEALDHVARYGTGHSEAIVTSDPDNIKRWVNEVDAAAVVVNASTRFVDGGELGLGGEVGISTQKLHARGPMGLRELTCLKWVIQGEGQIR